MTVFREPDISPTESSDDEEFEEMERSGFEDEGTAEAPKIQSPARWSSQFNLLSLHDAHTAQQQQAALLPVANVLPHEILLHIFRHLSSTRDLYSVLLVSRSWCQCSVELLWSKPQFTKLSGLLKLMNVLGKKERDAIFQYGSFIRRLNFTLLGDQLSDQMLLRARKCVRLERLTLFGCSRVTDEALEKVLQCTPNLVALDVTGVVEATDKSIIAAADNSPRLQGVNLGGCKKVTDAGVSALATQCPHLRRIKLSGLENVTDATVRLLARHCPMLLELDLHNCPLVTDDTIREIWTRSAYLREFRLSGVVGLTEKAFPAAPQPNHNVTLASITLPIGVNRPDPGPPPLLLGRSFDHLRVLDLTGCSHMTDDAMEGIVVNCPKIRNLVLAKCINLTDEAIGSICKLGRYLHYLHLGHVSLITDRAVTRLARACTRLRYIDLACCPLLSDMSVYELAVLPKLRRIGLVRVPNLTDQAIYAIGDTQTHLERIHLSYCENISVQAINYLLQRLQKLTHLSLTGIPAFRKPELQQFCRAPPKEFTPNQRLAFCVYSGHGVVELRRYLQSYMQAQDGGRPATVVQNGSDADDDDDGDVGGGFIDLGEVREQEPYPPPPAYSPSLGYRADAAGNQGLSNGFANTRTPRRSDTEGTLVVHPNGNVIQAPTHQFPQNVQLHLNGPVAGGSRSTSTPLPFPLTARTSPTSTPEPNGTNQQPVQVNGAASHPSNSSPRRHSPGFLSFATAIARGTWMGTSTRQADGNDSSPPQPPVNGTTSGAGPSTPQIGSVVGESAAGPPTSSPVMRQWNPNPVSWGHSAGGSQLPSPSNSAAAFAMGGSNSQGVSPSTSSRRPSSREGSIESLLTVRQRSSSRQEIRALEESLQDALGGGSQSSSRGRERQRGAPNGFAPSSYSDPAAGSSSRSNSSRQGSGNGGNNNYSPADGWQGRSRT